MKHIKGAHPPALANNTDDRRRDVSPQRLGRLRLPALVSVTNPFNQVIDKAKVLERVQANIIRYTSMTKKVEHVRPLRADMAVIMGLETAQVTPDANRGDAGKMTYRCFTEVWELRAGDWKKVVRHANHFEPESSAGQ